MYVEQSPKIETHPEHRVMFAKHAFVKTSDDLRLSLVSRWSHGPSYTTGAGLELPSMVVELRVDSEKYLECETVSQMTREGRAHICVILDLVLLVFWQEGGSMSLKPRLLSHQDKKERLRC